MAYILVVVGDTTTRTILRAPVILAQARPEVLSNIGVFRLQRRGATGFLDKPILGRELFERVETVLAA